MKIAKGLGLVLVSVPILMIALIVGAVEAGEYTPAPFFPPTFPIWRRFFAMC